MVSLETADQNNAKKCMMFGRNKTFGTRDVLLVSRSKMGSSSITFPDKITNENGTTL